jgi:hypothetical protein
MENKILYNLLVLEWNARKLIKTISKHTNNPIEELEREYELFLESEIAILIKLIGNFSGNLIETYETREKEIYLGTDEWIVSQSNIE